MNNTADDERVRIDKWLWAARFFKTRLLAAAAVKGAKVQVNGQRAKPGRSLKLNEELRIQRGTVVMVVKVRQLSMRRGLAVQAQQLYEETESSCQSRLQRQAEQAIVRLQIPLTQGRPSKKQRRDLSRWRGR